MSEHHPKWLAHHFDTPKQQFEAAKLGMWLFLATEVLFFSGLFCAYAVYRSLHPEVFVFAHQYLDKVMGGINTCVLLISSFTMAWAVRCAQLGKRTATVVLLGLTILCAFGFLGIKYVEYKHKWEHGLLWGKKFTALQHEATAAHGAASDTKAHAVGDTGAAAADTAAGHGGTASAPHDLAAHAAAPPSADIPVRGGTASIPGAASSASPSHAAEAHETTAAAGSADRSLVPPPAPQPTGLAHAAETPEHGAHGGGDAPRNVHIFFGIYFAMTGLHAIHVIGGIFLLTWIMVRAWRGEFGPEFFTPVDLSGLYWHLVDLIWIYLFPLFYLIH
jgi:cytochrome c oxidase subunit III